MTLQGANSYTGSTTISNGTTVRLDNASALGSTSGVIINSGTLDLQGFNASVGALSGSSSAVITSGSTGTRTVTSSFASGTSTYAGRIQNGSGTLALTKSGAGTLVMSGSNTYSGGTIVSAGTLLVNNIAGSGLGSGGVTVNGGVLGGTGGFTGALTVSSGTLAPGASIETLASGVLTLNDDSTLAYEVDSGVALSAGADLLKVSGNLNLNDDVTLTLTDIAGAPVAFALNTTFSLINYTGSWNGGLLTVNGNVIADGGTFTVGLNTWQLDYNAAEGGSNFTGEYFGGSDSFVNITTVVPEPATYAFLGLGSMLLLASRRRVARRSETRNHRN